MVVILQAPTALCEDAPGGATEALAGDQHDLQRDQELEEHLVALVEAAVHVPVHLGAGTVRIGLVHLSASYGGRAFVDL